MSTIERLIGNDYIEIDASMVCDEGILAESKDSNS